MPKLSAHLTQRFGSAPFAKPCERAMRAAMDARRLRSCARRALHPADGRCEAA